ncbi:MAG TPA: hypothetical protein VFB00_07240 [Terriglobales bacterium]|nr:hypothetical protein [Terriglobales bacterium]
METVHRICREHWGKCTDIDWETTAGKTNQLVGRRHAAKRL